MNKKEIENRTIGFYLKYNILKPYLIHVEFELENLIMKLKTDKLLNRLILLKDSLMNVDDYIISIEVGLKTIRELIRIHRVD